MIIAPNSSFIRIERIASKCFYDWRSWRKNIFVGLVLLFPYPGLLDAAMAAAAQAGEAMAFDSAPIVVDGRKLGIVRGIPAYPAKRRAEEIADEIKAYASDPNLPLEELRVEETDKASIIVGPTGEIMNVFDFDAQFENLEANRSVVANAALIRIKEAISEYREDRRPEILLRNTGYAVALTMLAILVLFGARWGFKKFSAWVERRIPPRLEIVEEKSFRLFDAKRLWIILRGALVLSAVVFAAVFGYLYINAVLGLFPWTRPLATQLFELVLDPLWVVGVSILDYLPNLVFLVIIFFVFRYLVKALHALFSAISADRITFSGFDPEWAWPTYRLVRLPLLAFAVVLAYPYIPGSESAAFKGVTIFLGVLASIGSSSVIANVVAGYTMTYRKAFKIGDRIRIGSTVGDVTQMRLLVTHLRTVKNEEVVIPNSVILNNEVTNFSSFSKEQGLILHTSVGIGYEVPWRQVEAMLLLAAKKTPGIVTNREPFVLPTSLGDYAITYELNVYIDDAKKTVSLLKALRYNIVDVFNEYGVAIMTPSYVSDPEEPKVVPKDNWYAAPAMGAPGKGQS